MEQHSTRGLYSIGEAAEATGLSVKAIRHYEEVGLIPRPRRHDGNARTGGNRLYTEQDLSRLRFIRQARHLDLGLDEIRRLLEIAEETCPSRHPDYRRILTGHLETVTRRIAQLSDLQARLTTLLSKDESEPVRRCAGDGCGCLDAAPTPHRKRAGGEAKACRGRRRKGRDPGSP
jgi:MerR family gold-responsive transcriptional activator of gol and ges genes